MATSKDSGKLDRILVEARRARESSEQDYRAQALKLFPHLCGRCAREFSGANLRMLTVHHKNGNHDNNPSDGSNWELLCLYCHDAEHSKLLDQAGRDGAAPGEQASASTYKAFADLKALLKPKG